MRYPSRPSLALTDYGISLTDYLEVRTNATGTTTSDIFITGSIQLPVNGLASGHYDDTSRIIDSRVRVSLVMSCGGEQLCEVRSLQTPKIYVTMAISSLEPGLGLK